MLVQLNTSFVTSIDDHGLGAQRGGHSRDQSRSCHQYSSAVKGNRAPAAAIKSSEQQARACSASSRAPSTRQWLELGAKICGAETCYHGADLQDPNISLSLSEAVCKFYLKKVK